MIYFLIFIILILIFIIYKLLVTSDKNDNKVIIDSFKQDYEKYKPSLAEIEDVKNQIKENGFYVQRNEWKLMTEIHTKIELRKETHTEYYLVTIDSSLTIITFQAATIERALHFKKIYESLQQELFYQIGFSCWKSKNEL